MTRIGHSDLDIFPLAFGGNVFGWTADRDTSFQLLDAFIGGGGNHIDTADSYSAWVPGNWGGESETIIGQWLAARKPANVTVATKVFSHPDYPGLSAANVRQAAQASLHRLGVDTIDLYYAHHEDDEVPLEETVEAFAGLVRDGLIRYVGVSNYSPEKLGKWLEIAKQTGAPAPVAIQPHYNLVHRFDVENGLIQFAQEHGLSLLPYYALASGFLTGKYRKPNSTAGGSPRAGRASEYATPEGLAIIDTLEDVANAHGTSVTSVALTWLRMQPTIAAPIASASRVEQVHDLLASATLDLSEDELAAITRVSEPGSDEAGGK